jgi:hypothetical protein
MNYTATQLSGETVVGISVGSVLACCAAAAACFAIWLRRRAFSREEAHKNSVKYELKHNSLKQFPLVTRGALCTDSTTICGVVHYLDGPGGAPLTAGWMRANKGELVWYYHSQTAKSQWSPPLLAALRPVGSIDVSAFLSGCAATGHAASPKVDSLKPLVTNTVR